MKHYRTACPYSVYKGKPYGKYQQLVLDEMGFRNPLGSCKKKIDWMMMGSSVVYGHDTGHLAEDLQESLNGELVYNLSFGTWNTAQIISQYFFVGRHLDHKGVILLVGYNDIFNPIVFDSRPQYPYNFFLQELIYAETKKVSVGGIEHYSTELELSQNDLNQLRQQSFQKYWRHEVSGKAISHAEEALKAWGDSLWLFCQIASALGKKIRIFPQHSILDKAVLHEKEREYVNSQPKLFEYFEFVRKNYYWPFIEANPQIFSKYSGDGYLDTEEFVFTDAAHMTPVAYKKLAKNISIALA